MKNRMMQSLTAVTITLAMSGCHTTDTSNVAVCEANCKEAPAALQLACKGDCKEAARSVKLPTGWHVLPLDQDEQKSLNQAAAESPSHHVAIGLLGGKFTFQSDADASHAPSSGGKIAVQTAPGREPTQVTVTPTSAAAAALRQRFATPQNP